MKTATTKRAQPTAAAPASITYAELPRIGARLFDGAFAGIVRGDDGGPDVALFDLGSSGKDLSWAAAKKWAESLGASLATRSEGRILHGNIDLHAEQRPTGYFWLGEQCAGDEAYAWSQTFDNGYQYYGRKDYTLRARAVRRLPIR